MAAVYFKRGFELSNKHPEIQNFQDADCAYAISLAHGLFTGAAEQIFKNNTASLDLMLNWKNERIQGFSNDLQTYEMYKTPKLQDEGLQSSPPHCDRKSISINKSDGEQTITEEEKTEL